MYSRNSEFFPSLKKKFDVAVARIANGKVVEDNWVYDALGMMRQLGAVPSVVAKAA